MRECEQKALNFLIKSGWVLWGNASMAKGSKLACEDVSGELRMIHLAKAVNCSRVAKGYPLVQIGCVRMVIDRINTEEQDDMGIRTGSPSRLYLSL